MKIFYKNSFFDTEDVQAVIPKEQNPGDRVQKFLVIVTPGGQSQPYRVVVDEETSAKILEDIRSRESAKEVRRIAHDLNL